MLANLGQITRIHDIQIGQKSRLSQSLLVPIFPEWLTEADIIPDRSMSDVGLLRGISNRVDQPRFVGPVSLYLPTIERDRIRGCPRCEHRTLENTSFSKEAT